MDNRTESLATSNRPPRRVVLASTSTYRRQLLERLHIPFEAINPGVDETPFQERKISAIDLTQTLAQTKAHAVRQTHPHDIVIGCDQCVTIDDLVLGKPGSADIAMEQLAMLSGRTHKLDTALCLLHPPTGEPNPTEMVSVDVHEITMRRLNRCQIRRYVELDQPIDCAGSYKIESLGIALFERVSGTDPTAIMGMSLMRLVSMLAEAGYDVFEHASAPSESLTTPMGDVRNDL